MQDQPKDIRIAALIVAAGRGHRAYKSMQKTPKNTSLAKQYRQLPSGEQVLTRTLKQFETHHAIDTILTVIHPDDETLYQTAAAGIAKATAFAKGGATRQASVLNGLKALEKHAPQVVLIHDAARPFVSHEIINEVIDALSTYDAALPVLDVTDTIRHVCATGSQPLERASLKRAQTPQGFKFDIILAAHKNAVKQAQSVTDDITLAESNGYSVALVKGDEANIKLTTEQDFITINRMDMLENMQTHTALGFDVHRFRTSDDGGSITLGGLKISHSRSLEGHSDADVALHALTDALLGTISAGDIGAHFPPSNETHKNRDSADFLQFAVDKITAVNGRIIHLDLTLICEAPKIDPHRDAMQARIAEICGISPKRVSVKATTTEKLGFTGRGEGIAAQAVASVLLPDIVEN